MSILSHSSAPSAIGEGNVPDKGENPPMSSVNYSHAPSASCNNNALAKGENPPMSSANYSHTASASRNSNVLAKGENPLMSSANHSHAPSASCNNNVLAKGKNPPMSSVNHSHAPSASCNNNVLAKGENPPMSSANHSHAPSASCNNNALAKGENPPMSSANHSHGPSASCNNNALAKGKNPPMSSVNYSHAPSASCNSNALAKGENLPMSSANHSHAPSASCNKNVLAKGENPPMSSANHSHAPSASYKNSVLAKGKKPIRPFPMSSVNNSPATSAVCNGKVSDKGKEPAWGSPFNEANEAGPSVISGSSLYPNLSNSIRMSSQCSYLDAVPQRCSILNYNYNGGINGVFRNSKHSLPGLPNGPRPCYSEEIGEGNYSRGGNHRQGGYDYWYDQNCCHEMMTNSYQDLRGIAPHMQQPPEQLRSISMPLTSPPMCPVSFNGNHVPSYLPTFQGPIGLSHVPFDVYRLLAHPQAQYLSGSSYVVPRPEQSDFFSSLDDLRARLRKQIEYYFSSENLRKDYYLKNLMDGHGWVIVTLIMKFRKVVALLKEKEIKMQSANISDVLQVRDRSLSDDQQFVLDSVRPSEAVEVQGDRMRERHEWEKWVSKPPINKII